MNGLQELDVTLKAGYAFFYLNTQEVGRTINLIKEWRAKTTDAPMEFWDLEKDGDPMELFQRMDNENFQNNIMVAKNWNWFLWDDFGKPNRQFCAMLLNRFEPWTTKDFRRTLIIVSNTSFERAIPDVVAREFFPLSFGMPDCREIESLLTRLVDSVKSRPNFKSPSESDVQRIISASNGMTSREITNAFAYSLVKTGGKIDPLLIAKMRAKDVEKTSGLRIVDTESGGDLKGYGNLFDFVTGTMNSKLSKGIILLGPPGTGKTTFARIVGRRSGRIVFSIEFAQLFGSLVGETEEKFARCFEVISANAPCIVILDEIEKGLSGAAGSSGDRDGGTAVRAAAQVLKFLSDERPEGVYIMATCNDIQALAPEWVRPGRWDCSPFFIDLPDSEERKAIWVYHMERYKVKGDVRKVHSVGWSGAEIEACCRIASMLKTDITKAASYVLPVSKTMSEKIDYLRKWSLDRTIPASTKFEFKKSEERDLTF